MSQVTLNQTFDKQQKTRVRATFKKAFINAIHTSANTVDVYLAENPQNILRNIPIASTVDVSNLKVGQLCRVDIFDETNSNDMCLAYTIGGTATVVTSTTYAGQVGSGGSWNGVYPAGWSVNHVGTGVYDVTHNLNTAGYVAVICTVGSVGRYDSTLWSQSANSFRVETFQYVSGSWSNADVAFNFMVYKK